jgi:hypothetical protein
MVDGTTPWTSELKASSGSGPPGSSAGLTAVHVEAPEDQLEVVARSLVIAVAEANAAYPERYATWRQERDAQVAEECRREEQRSADHQAIRDRVLDEYRSDSTGWATGEPG